MGPTKIGWSTTLAAIIVLAISANGEDLPHPGCRLLPSTILSAGPRLDCLQLRDIQIPGNFNVSRIAPYIRTLQMGPVSAVSPNLTNVIHETVEPIPVGNGSLQSVEMRAFRSGGKWTPFATFLSQIKATLLELIVDGCDVTELPATFMDGFHALQRLGIEDCALDTVHLSAFASGASVAAFHEVYLPGNKLGSFDLAVFAPVANSLRWINLSNQKVPLKTLTNSAKVSFSQLHTFHLINVGLTFPHRSVLETLQPDKMETINLQNNSFCLEDGTRECACCEAEEFVQWAYTVRFTMAKAYLMFTCGHPYVENSTLNTWFVSNGSDHYPYAPTKLPSTGQYDNCRNSGAGEKMVVTLWTFVSIIFLGLTSGR